MPEAYKVEDLAVVFGAKDWPRVGGTHGQFVYASLLRPAYKFVLAANSPLYETPAFQLGCPPAFPLFGQAFAL